MKKSAKTVRDILREQSDDELLWNLDQRSPDVQAKICLELGRRKVKAVGAVRSRLSSQESALREAAAEALGEIGDLSAAPKLLNLLLDRNQPEGVRDTCAFALAKLKYGAGVAEVASALNDPSPSVRLCVIAALLAIGKAEVCEQVEFALAIETDETVKVAMRKLLDSLCMKRRSGAITRRPARNARNEIKTRAPSAVKPALTPQVVGAGQQPLPGFAVDLTRLEKHIVPPVRCSDSSNITQALLAPVAA